MTLGAVSGSDSSSAVSFCSCCGAKMVPYFSDDALVTKNEINQLISESFLTVKGAAVFLPRGKSPTPNSAPPVSQRRNKHAGDLQKHLQTMFTVLRPEDTIRLAVRLESVHPQVTRYMVVVSTNGRQDTEESIVLGIDFLSSDSCCTVGLVLPLWSDTLIHLDGDGGFSVSTVNRVHVFKPVSVQAMWSALQSLHKACDVARCHNHYPGSLFLTWISYYQSRISSNQFCINEWNAMQDVESHRANSPAPFTDLPTERERTERLIKMRLREIMMQKDLENVTCKEIRTELEMQMACNLREFKEFIDKEMIVILGQMDSPTEIFEHVYLGSEWNASNMEELQNSGVRYILNVTREIDNFFPGMFEYHNIRVYDEEATNLLEYWNETYKFITKAKKAGAKCLVHCKMGVSRSASTVIAYAMKEYGWDLDTAFDYVKERRAVTKPNPSFMKQLEEYQGILLASKQRHNKLWRSHSDSDLLDRSDLLCKMSSHSLGRSDSHNNNNNASSPSLQHFLGVAVLHTLGAEPEDSAKSKAAHTPESHSHTNGLCESPFQEEVGSDCDEMLLLPLPRPRAATVVPEERLDNSASVAVTVPVALPHPPPSLHILPPTPELQRVRRSPPTHLAISVPKHKSAELSLILHDRGSSEEISPLTLGSTDSDIIDQSLSDLSSDKHSPLSPANTTPHTLVLPLPASDDNNNPSGIETGGALDSRGDADGSSNHSTDSIDFFSAREKFLGLAQDGGTRTVSEQTLQRTPTSQEENGEMGIKDEEEQVNGSQVSPLSDECDDKAGPDCSHHPRHDNGISVRHIVTEIEAICHPVSCLPPSPSPSPTPSPSLPPSSHSAQLIPQEPHQEGTESCDVSPGSLSPPSHPHSPSMLPCDWPAGSVRRATKQLEQKLRQELEMAAAQRSPLHSPNTENPPVRLSQCSPSAEHPPLCSPCHSTEQSNTQGEIMAVSTKSKDGEKQTGSQHELQSLDSSGTHKPSDPPCSPNSNNSQISGAIPVTVYTPLDSHMLTSSLASTPQSVEPSLNTSSQSQGQSPLLSQTLRPASSDQITLDGATVQESETDEKLESSSRGSQEVCGPSCDAQCRLSRGSQELERIQQTLKELQAFLHDGISLETTDSEVQQLEQPQGLRDGMDTEPGPCKGASIEHSPPDLDEGHRLQNRQEGKSVLEPSGWHRAMELEARIRQAGLTPPSLMKRSASLAKLDCLELSANDLSDLDLRPHIRTSSSHSQDSLSTSPAHSDDTWKKQKVLSRNICAEKLGSSHDDSASPRSLCPSSASPHCPTEETGEREEAASCLQARGHASRRSRKVSVEKKQRAVAVLYNTM
ncbi:phosphatase Slingshot-like 2 isoform X1 [Solea senegalensis]|uniref:protein-serine/threonine phosphatase n=2 Tax=Solea senegalensis TaxID=28829 RepID=A0AAV6PVN7_SOLSE|nr:protein phosphatase Slingshot homolog 2 isoform X1 [Solea senegalensis]KAG7479029.1 phosphatase Slingshot-like 2 isoform X1 [Solea senegalensis]